ncbi:homing endonuclease [Bacillus phage AR9]|uniref:Homing endonuclease n=1 Tax=Bacillus phage AR9 TaxID=1815509 RepID=A0A172JHY1_BPPB1|nr:HNH endonuclease [Bacillus phage AR9]AMS01163.1 homing endonuclease [Bacillus phage AR9]
MPRKKSNEKFMNEVKELVGEEYTFLERYVRSLTKIKVKHNICNNIYMVTPNDFLNGGKRCPKCANNIKRTNKEFVSEIRKLVGNEYTFLDEYINTDTPIGIIHNICKHVYKISPKEFIHRNSRCPKCNFLNNESFFSKVIKKTLNELNIYFIQEYSIKELGKGKKFDFYIPSLNLIIEYDGSQHFYQKFNDKNGFLSQIKRDQEKNDFIKNSEYTLVRINYKMNKNLDIIIKELIKESSTTIEKYNLLLISKDNITNFKEYYKNANINYFDYIK